MKKTDLKQFIKALSQIGKSIHQFTYCSQKNYKMYPGQPRFLWLLKEHEGLTQMELARKHYVKPSTITGMLAKLEAHHYVYRISDETDKRNMRVYLTPEGKKLAMHGEAIITRIAHKMFEGFSDEEFQTYLRLTQKISDNSKDLL
jgi:DNA-binding MarR family transcriptional regulator